MKNSLFYALLLTPVLVFASGLPEQLDQAVWDLVPDPEFAMLQEYTIPEAQQLITEAVAAGFDPLAVFEKEMSVGSFRGNLLAYYAFRNQSLVGLDYYHGVYFLEQVSNAAEDIWEELEYEVEYNGRWRNSDASFPAASPSFLEDYGSDDFLVDDFLGHFIGFLAIPSQLETDPRARVVQTWLLDKWGQSGEVSSADLTIHQKALLFSLGSYQFRENELPELLGMVASLDPNTQSVVYQILYQFSSSSFQNLLIAYGIIKQIDGQTILTYPQLNLRVRYWASQPFEEDPELISQIKAFFSGLRDFPLEFSTDIYSGDWVRATSLFNFLSARSQIKHIEYLLEQGFGQESPSWLRSAYAPYDPEGKGGGFSLLYAKYWFGNINNDRDVDSAEALEAMSRLISLGWNPYLEANPYSTGMTDLFREIAVENDLELLKTLVDLGAQPNAPDSRGRTTLEILRAGLSLAQFSEYQELLEYLESFESSSTNPSTVTIIESQSSDSDTLPPRINFYPLDSNRGLTPIITDEWDAETNLSSISVSGLVFDDQYVDSLVVNDAEIVFSSDGVFQARVTLDLGENRLNFKATDSSGNTTTESLIIWRNQQRTLAQELGVQGNFYALLIGNEAYREMEVLRTPHEDVSAIAGILESQYNFETTVLLDATRAEILGALNQMSSRLKAQDHLVFYYAGHGYFEEDANLAYWLPVDAAPDDDTNWILADRITGRIRSMEASHIALISDSCYSGMLQRSADIDLASDNQDQEEYLRRMLERPSRTVLSSGGNEPVSDGGGGNHSVFAKYLITALEENQEQAISLEQMFYRDIQVQVAGNARQTPEYQPIGNSGHEGGDFVFFRD